MTRQPRLRIGRTPSTAQLRGIPIVSVMLASMAPVLPVIHTVPVSPPWAFLLLLAWRMIHRTMWPVWMGLPLGLFDDLFSGQPLGSAMTLWTLALLAMDVIDRRMIWRVFNQEWALAAGLTSALLFAQLLIAYSLGGATPPHLLIPQLIFSALAFPLIARFCMLLDYWRLSA